MEHLLDTADAAHARECAACTPESCQTAGRAPAQHGPEAARHPNGLHCQSPASWRGTVTRCVSHRGHHCATRTLWLLGVLCCVLAARAAVHVTPAEQAVLRDLVPGYVPRVHTRPPPTPRRIVYQPRHWQYLRYNLQSPRYMAWVKQEVKALNHVYEEFAYTRDWDAFTVGGEDLLHPAETVTCVACSPERLPFVRRMLRHWQGPMALAIYIPHPAKTPEGDACRERMVDYITDMAGTTTAPFALSFLYANEHQVTLHCNITMHSTGLEPAWVDKEELVRRYGGQEYLTVYDALYPVNHARNLVVNMVQTNAFVFLVDADFVPSGTPGTFYRTLKADPAMQRIRTRWTQRREREVLLLPAWERLRINFHPDPATSSCHPETPDCWLYEQLDVPYTKEKLLEMVAAGEMQSFYLHRYPAAYGCYQANERWPTTTTEYPAKLTEECEPYIIGLKDAMPPYDNRFRGYVMDKVSFLRHVTILGTIFTVHPTLFIVHLPHNRAYSIDDLEMRLPAKYDRRTVAKVLECIVTSENFAEVAFNAAVREGNTRAAALARGEAAGAAHFPNCIQYWVSILPLFNAGGHMPNMFLRRKRLMPHGTSVTLPQAHAGARDRAEVA